MTRFFLPLLTVFFSFCLFFNTPAALAYDNPDLLPPAQTPIIDLAKALTPLSRRAVSYRHWSI
jgi:hypothetical protein